MRNSDSDVIKQQKIGVLIVNLGSPDAPTAPAVRRYLKQFLSDPRVVKTSRLIWWLVLNVIILNLRPKPVAKAYQSVWTDDGSPLVATSQKQAAAISKRLVDEFNGQVITELAMTYGTPSIQSALTKLREAGAEKILVLPMYPQFSYTTTAAVTDGVESALNRMNFHPELHTINDYHDHPAYIDAIADSIRQQWSTQDRAKLLVFSFHGIPQRYVNQGDPYYAQCCETTRLLNKELNLKEGDSRLVFQSRFGRQPWLQPYCDKTMMALPGEGITSIDILCPGFSADCLETLDEIQHENKGYFLAARGKSFNYIPCLNASDEHIDALVIIIKQHLANWIA